jgi:hypothetical protein
MMRGARGRMGSGYLCAGLRFPGGLDLVVGGINCRGRRRSREGEPELMAGGAGRLQRARCRASSLCSGFLPRLGCASVPVVWDCGWSGRVGRARNA